MAWEYLMGSWDHFLGAYGHNLYWYQQPNGKWVIVEEMMQTKQQIFLKYAK